MTTATPRAPVGPSDLVRLVEAEQRLEAALAEARREAARVLESARADAAALEAGQADETARARAALIAGIEAETARRRAELLADAAREAARYQRVAPDRIATLVREVLGRIAGAEEGRP